MAKIISRQKSLKYAFWERILIGIGEVVIGVAIIFSVSYQISIRRPETFVIFFGILLGVVLTVIGVVLIRKGEMFRRGIHGETRVAEVLSTFPDDWYVFNDINIGSTQIDHLLVSPKGIYLIETKNRQGAIYGNAQENDWEQVIDRYKRPFYNPTRQVKRYAVALRRYFEDGGLRGVWVNAVVVFPHPTVQLNVTSPEVPVIHISALQEFFNCSSQRMSSEECIRLVNLIETLSRTRRKWHWGWWRIIPLTISLMGFLFIARVWFFPTSQYPNIPHEVPGVINWDETRNYYEKEVTVKGKIENIVQIEGSYYLNFSKKDWKRHLTAVIHKEKVGFFPDKPDKYYDGKKVLIKGIVTKGKKYSRPEIILENLNQITITE